MHRLNFPCTGIQLYFRIIWGWYCQALDLTLSLSWIIQERDKSVFFFNVVNLHLQIVIVPYQYSKQYLWLFFLSAKFPSTFLLVQKLLSFLLFMWNRRLTLAQVRVENLIIIYCIQILWKSSNLTSSWCY